MQLNILIGNGNSICKNTCSIIIPLLLECCIIIVWRQLEQAFYCVASAAHFFIYGDIDMERRYELFGQKMTYCREFLGYSKKDMASAMGVSPSTYSKFEKGLSMPSVDSLHIVSIISDVSMEDFVDEDFSLEDFIHEITTPLDQRFIQVLEDIKEETRNKKTGE